MASSDLPFRNTLVTTQRRGQGIWGSEERIRRAS